MSIMSDIRDTAYELFNEKGECTLAEIKAAALEKGITIPRKSTLVRSTIYQLSEKDPHIKRVDRGRYRYIADVKDQQCQSLNEKEDHIVSAKEVIAPDSIKEEDRLIDYLNMTQHELMIFFKELENFKWFQSSDEEVERVRKRGIKVKAFYEAIGEKVNKVLR